jgi:hypothetical protein
MWVLWRTDQGRGWVTRPGSRGSYSRRLQDARTWPTREAAEADRCPENEVAERVEDILCRA